MVVERKKRYEMKDKAYLKITGINYIFNLQEDNPTPWLALSALSGVSSCLVKKLKIDSG